MNMCFTSHFFVTLRGSCREFSIENLVNFQKSMQIHLHEVTFSYNDKIKQNLSFVSTPCKLKKCFSLLNCANLSLSKLPSHSLYFQVLKSMNKATVNIGKDRENLSIVIDYVVVPLLIDLVNRVRVPFDLKVVVHSVSNLIAMFSLPVMIWLRASYKVCSNLPIISIFLPLIKRECLFLGVWFPLL